MKSLEELLHPAEALSPLMAHNDHSRGAVPSFTQQRIMGDFFWLGLMSHQFKEICNHILQIIKKKMSVSSTHTSTSSTLEDIKKKKKNPTANSWLSKGFWPTECEWVKIKDKHTQEDWQHVCARARAWVTACDRHLKKMEETENELHILQCSAATNDW